MKLDDLTVDKFAGMFDMAILAPETQEAAIREGARTARRYKMAAFYTTPCWTKIVAEELKGCEVKVGVAISFPYGTLSSEMKFAEMKDAIKNGGNSLDMVINIGALKDGNYDLVRKEIEGLVKIAHENGALAKSILEIGTLTDDEIAAATKIACESGVDYVKTSTGANILPDITQLEIMRDNMSGLSKMKLSGVPRQFTLAAVLRMIEMGVELIGTRSAAKLIDQYKAYLDERNNG